MYLVPKYRVYPHDMLTIIDKNLLSIMIHQV